MSVLTLKEKKLKRKIGRNGKRSTIIFPQFENNWKSIPLSVSFPLTELWKLQKLILRE